MTYKRKSSTARQKEAQRLFQERGLLERTRANIRIVMKDCNPCPMDRYELAAAEDTIRRYIEMNKHMFQTISSRIPPDLKQSADPLDTLT